MHIFNNGGSATHINQFLRRLHGPLPVNKRRSVNHGGFGQTSQQMAMGSRRIIVIVKFHPNGGLTKTRAGQQGRQVLESVALGGHHVIVGVSNDVAFVHVDGA